MSETEFNHSTENWSLYAQKITSPVGAIGSTGNLTITATKNIILNSNNVIIGRNAGLTSQGTNAIAIGFNAGNSGQGTNAIAIGNQAGYTNQGSGAIAIGYQAGQTSQPANSIVINANPTQGLSGGTALAFYVAPIRNYTQSTILGYDSTSKEITYYNQNLNSEPVITITGGAGTATVTASLAIDFKNSYTSVTNYSVSYNNSYSGLATITINPYNFTNAIVGSQYTIGISLTHALGSNGTIRWVFNGQVGFTYTTTPSGPIKTNFSDITIDSVGYAANVTKYLILTIAYDGSSYYMAGSQFA